MKLKTSDLEIIGDFVSNTVSLGIGWCELKKQSSLQVRNQVDDQISIKVWNQIYDEVRDQVDDQILDQIKIYET